MTQERILQQLIRWDRDLTARLSIPRESRFLRVAAFVAAHSGDSPLWIAGGMAALFGNLFWRGVGARVLVGTLVAGAACTILKWIVHRRRPPGAGSGVGFYSRFDQHSFPSGHAGRSACIVVLLAPLLSIWVILLMALWALLVGLARAALQVHFVSDIAGGWLVGLFAGFSLLVAL